MNPDFDDRLEQAVSLHRSGQFAQACEHYAAIRSNFEHPGLTINHARALFQLKRYDEALEVLGAMIEGAGAHFGALAASLRGRILRELGEGQTAIVAFQEALKLDPEHGDAQVGLAKSLRETGNPLESLSLCSQLLTSAMLSEDMKPKVLVAAAQAFRDLGRLDESMRFLENCLKLYPSEIEAWTTLGIILVSLGEVEHGIGSFDRALAIDPDYPFAQWNKSLALLSIGNYAEGWRLYEARWQLRGGAVPELHADLPRLPANQAIDNLDILLVAEQGLGDCIQFVRYAAIFIQQGARVHLHVPKVLVRLFASLQRHAIGVASITALDDLPPRADFFLPMMSLPTRLGLGHPPDSTPFPYLSANHEKIATWKPRLSLPRPRVGLVWYGGSAIQMKGQETINQFRNLDLWQLSSLLSLEVNFIGLQQGGLRDEDRFGALLADIPTLSSRWQLLGPLLEDFDDTAAVIQELDLVISVDTSVAHLAAAMNKPVWMLHRHGGCWRWMHKGQNSDWYPSMRIFRQNNPQNWNETIDEIREALERFLLAPTAVQA